MMAAHQGWEGEERQATRREMCMDSAPMSGGSMCRVVVAGVSAIALFCLAASAGEHARPAGMLESFEPDCILAICQIYVYRHSVYGIRPGRRDDAGQNPES
jgi:hypothetical protein